MCGMWWDSGQYCTRQATASNNLCLIGGTRECQDVLCERGTHLNILVMMIKNGRSVLMCQCFYTEMIFSPPLVSHRLCWKGKMVAAAGHFIQRMIFPQWLQPLLCKMNPGGHCFCQSTARECLGKRTSISDCLTDSCFECSYQLLFGSLLIDIFWWLWCNTLRFVKTLRAS